MKVFLIRHAEAEPYTSDPKRRLTPQGEQQAVRVAHFLREGGQFDPAEIWHSGLPRSTETAAIMQRCAAPTARLIEHPEVLPESDPRATLDLLCTHAQSIAIVGHHPHLHELFAMMMGSHSSDLWEIVKAGVACINGHDYYTGLGRRERRWAIFWMITPRILGAPEAGADLS